jgi:hypothetical protein
MRKDLFIEYQPFTYPYYPYRVVWYINANDSIGTDLGGAKSFEEALIIMRHIYVMYDHVSPTRVDVELRYRYGKAYERALRKYGIRIGDW